jgi:VanZ like family
MWPLKSTTWRGSQRSSGFVSRPSARSKVAMPAATVSGRKPSVAAYAVAAFFLCLACYHRVPPVQLVLLLTAYGALLELGQLWVPGRNGQLSDIGADLAGASIGVMVALVTMRLRRFVPR